MLKAGDLTIPLGDISNGGRNDDFGYGMIDANKAVSAAIAEDGSPPEPKPWLGVFPGALNFGATLESLDMTLRNVSGGDLDILSIVSSEPWLEAPPLDGLKEYSVQIDRDRVNDYGSYTATLTIIWSSISGAKEVIVPVIMQKSRITLTGDVGHLHVRVIDTATGNIREVQTDVEKGEYVWQIDQLPPGTYQLIAYTDADNDNSVCDAGEACGSYLTVTQPIAFDLTEGDLTGLDFPVSFGVSLSDPDDSDKIP
jgi:serine protease